MLAGSLMLLSAKGSASTGMQTFMMGNLAINLVL